MKRRSRRKIAWLCLSTALAVVALGCGSSTPSVNAGEQLTPHAATNGTGAAANRVISFRGVQFDVPGDWPVYDLAAAPSTCVRFDMHAVYLGHPGADQQCPAAVVGRSDAVLVEPADGAEAHAAAAGVSTRSINGLEVDVAAGGDISREMHATIPALGVAATITYRDSDATAQGIVQSLRASGG